MGRFCCCLAMKNMKSPFRGLINDFKGRKACYKQDWHDAFCSSTRFIYFRILAPTTYIFCASALPVIVFGEQLNRETDGSLSTVDTLASTAICGIIYSIFGGQPWLILGVVEPTVIMHTYLYNFTKEKADLGQELFLAWAGWVCVWTTILLLLLAAFNACTIISRFTRIAGELFGMLIVVLFMQEAIKGLVSEFRIPKAEDPTAEKYNFQWLYTNGLLAIIFSFGLLFTALKSIGARTWRLWGSLYGSNMVTIVVWCTYQNSFRSSQEALWSTSLGVCIFAPLDGNQGYGEGPCSIHLCCLHSCCDDHRAILFIETITQTLLYGSIGLPPANGVLPQSPMHTKSLAVLKRQNIKEFDTIEVEQKEDGKECQGMHKQQGSDSEIYGRMQAVFIKMDTTPDHAVAKELKNLKDAVMKSEDGGSKDGNYLEKHIDAHLPVRVNEQRVSNLLQSLLVGASLLAMPSIKMIPTSVLWGYFAYMALDSLPRNQFCERILLLFITPKRQYKILEGDHASFVELVPFSSISFPNCFTHSIFRSWMQLSMRKLLDGDKPLTGNENHEFESSDAEILDELMTNRGELKFRSVHPKDDVPQSK
ncbi:unnamed protein product [Camellia sinensis]